MRDFEFRNFPGAVVKTHDGNGIIDAYVSIFGLPDHSYYNDIVEPGAFTKTVRECGPEGSQFIKILNQHRVGEVIGKPLEMAEHTRDELPADIRGAYPKASGGLFVTVGLEMRVERARDVFYLYEGGAMREWSIGFQTIKSWSETVEKVEYRHLTEISLWECSPVTWGAGTTMTINVKGQLPAMISEAQRLHPELSDIEILQLLQKRFLPKLAEPAAPLTMDKDKLVLLRQQVDLNLQRLRGYV